MIITLCGSLKFEDDYKEADEKLTLVGHVVFTCSVYPSYKAGQKDWYTPEQKLALDMAHIAKIMHSDAIVVLDRDNYIGDSTRREIVFAKVSGKRIFYWFSDRDRSLLNA